MGDALILMRVSHFDLVLIGPELTSFAATHNGFQAACAKVAVIELGGDFSSRDAGKRVLDYWRRSKLDSTQRSHD